MAVQRLSDGLHFCDAEDNGCTVVALALREHVLNPLFEVLAVRGHDLGLLCGPADIVTHTTIMARILALQNLFPHRY